ncbi:MAG: YdcH family protein [Alphaproteobacteria bacterium]|nr:YdcH family protein [Alphaproteobacteria bacterium]
MADTELKSSQNSRLQALRNRHTDLSNQIEEAHRSPSTTDFFLRQLKKQKLIVKEEIHRIRESGTATA